MKKDLNISAFVNTKLLKKYFKRLFPICRSILGRGYRESLEIIGEMVDLKLHEFKSGSNVLDWTIPDEWNIKDAFIICPNGKKIAQFKKNNLHVVNYSIPINKTVNLKELKKHLHTLPKMPNAIPYITSYYNRDWGFCITHKEFKSLREGNYKVVITSQIKPGKLVYSDTLIKGKSKKEVLISTYLCHPQMANHELSGPLVWSMLYKILKNTGPHELSYRFLICPETVGSAAFLHKNKNNLKNIIAGYIINCVGYGKEINYKKSRIGNSIADKAALNVMENSNFPIKIENFEPWGSDEKQFCSPGFNLPIGLVMRKKYGGFKEYHTSLDNEKLINFNTILESIQIYYDILLTIDNNFIPLSKIKFGTPQLSKSTINLYRTEMSWKLKKMEDTTKFLLEILNLAEGKKDLIEIANDKNFKLINHLDLISNLLKSKYISKKNSS